MLLKRRDEVFFLIARTIRGVEKNICPSSPNRSVPGFSWSQSFSTSLLNTF